MHMKMKIILLAAMLAASGAMAQNVRKTPYWVSLSKDEARMRSGPGTEFPVKWIYKRRQLPLKVVAVHNVWRMVEDMDGDSGWMHVRLLSPDRSAVVTGADIAVLREEPSAGAKVNWRVEPGVVGAIEDCEKGWCHFDVDGRAGYIEGSRLWGDELLEDKENG